MSELVNLIEATQPYPGLTRLELLTAIKAQQIPCASTSAPYMVAPADVAAWVALHPTFAMKVFNRAAFVALFQPTEQVAIASNPQSLVWWLLLMDQPAIDLTNPTIVADMQSLVTLGVITQDRATAILTGSPLPLSVEAKPKAK